MRVGLSALADTCYIDGSGQKWCGDAPGSDVVPAPSNNPLDPNVCYGGGRLIDQAACVAANQRAAAAVAVYDPSGAVASACINSAYAASCLLGITDAYGNSTLPNPASVPSWVWLVGLGVAGFFVLEAVKH